MARTPRRVALALAVAAASLAPTALQARAAAPAVTKAPSLPELDAGVAVQLAAVLDFDRPTVKAVCDGDALPFPVAALRAPTDTNVAAWRAAAWATFCEGARSLAPNAYRRRVCKCRPD